MRRALAQPSTDPTKTRLEQWANELANEAEARGRLDVLRWLEGGSPKESVEPESTEPESTMTPLDLDAAIRAMGYVPGTVGTTEPGTLRDASQSGAVADSGSPGPTQPEAT